MAIINKQYSFRLKKQPPSIPYSIQNGISNSKYICNLELTIPNICVEWSYVFKIN